MGFFLFGLVSGLILSKSLQPETLKFTEFRRSQNYRFINPLLECDIQNPIDNYLFSQIRTDLNSIISDQKNLGHITHTSVYLRDLNNGPWLGIAEKEYFSPASLVKVPIMISLFSAAQKDPSLLSRQITIQPDDTSYEEQNILPSQTLIQNQTYSLEELNRRMIVYSDNRAKDLIVDQLSEETVFKTFTDLDVDIDLLVSDPDGNNLTVKDYASFYRILYNSSYLNREMSEKALSLLSQTDYDQGLVKNLPQNITVSHKYGERYYSDTQERQLHDCGIVYLPQKPYLLCVMTRGSDLSLLSQTVSLISDSVFKNLSAQN